MWQKSRRVLLLKQPALGDACGKIRHQGGLAAAWRPDNKELSMAPEHIPDGHARHTSDKCLKCLIVPLLFGGRIGRRRDFFAFSHLVFQEYLAA